LIENPHHIEIQIIADKKGKVLHLGERDCSMQRRNQKIIEECPSPMMGTKEGIKLRDKMGKAAVKLAEAVKYENAGTLEFLVDDEYNFYFMEMNTRIQVEHPVTEEVYGIDLIKEQIKVAAGLPLTLSQSDIIPRGHAVECRINAEDPFNNFMPSPGRIGLYYAPGGRGVRVDSHAYSGYNIPPYYDSMIAKLITIGKDRQDAINLMQRALGEYIIRGVKTIIPLQQIIMNDPNFRRGRYSTHFVGNLLEQKANLMETQK